MSSIKIPHQIKHSVLRFVDRLLNSFLIVMLNGGIENIKHDFWRVIVAKVFWRLSFPIFSILMQLNIDDTVEMLPHSLPHDH